MFGLSINSSFYSPPAVSTGVQRIRVQRCMGHTCPGQRLERFSGSLAVVIVQQPAEMFPPMHFALAAGMLRLGTDQCIG